MRLPRVIIIGGGIGGLCTAIALRRVGVEVRVYERAPEPREVGAGIGLAANAIRALRAIGAEDAVRAVCEPWRRAEMKTARGTTLARVDMSALESRLGAWSGAAHRAELLESLLTLLPPEVVRFDHELVEIRETGLLVQAEFANGALAQGDLLIGADGIRSRVRSFLMGSQPVRFAGYTAWRGVCDVPGDQVPPGYIAELWGAGARFGIVRLPRQRVYWWAALNSAPQDGQPDQDDRDLLLRAFATFTGPPLALLEATPPRHIIRSDVIDRPPHPQWCSGRVGLLGDAAHPTTPNLGQGACMAIEDAVSLAKCVLEHAGDPGAALRAFRDARYERTAAITRDSWLLGAVGQWSNPAACALRNAAMWLTPDRLVAASLLRSTRHDVGTLTPARTRADPPSKRLAPTTLAS